MESLVQEMRLPPEAVTYADLALAKTSEAVIAGVRLAKRSKTERGGIWYTPYYVLSLYIDDPRAQSVRAALPIVCIEALNCVDKETRLIVYRSPHPYFGRADKYVTEPLSRVVLAAQMRGIDVRFNFKPGLHRAIPDLQLLANDALRRKSSITCAV
jgi:hypothetical protein